MWVVLSPEGVPVFWSLSWDAAVTRAMRLGGDLDVVFQQFFRPEGQVAVEGDVDVHGDLT